MVAAVASAVDMVEDSEVALLEVEVALPHITLPSRVAAAAAVVVVTAAAASAAEDTMEAAVVAATVEEEEEVVEDGGRLHQPQPFYHIIIHKFPEIIAKSC